MITLNQIQLLDQKVELAVTKISALVEENKKLQTDCECLNAEKEVLHRKIAEYQDNQTQIEQSLLHALERLETIGCAETDLTQGFGAIQSLGGSEILAESTGELSVNTPQEYQSAEHSAELFATTEHMQEYSDTPSNTESIARQPIPETQFDIF
ncbi:hypothetical protein [Treponema endosymbiont of Eucomonympha sp.]|uniref:hypothetical protein n=1 Tax=Treponema endosymbiont of Eucomonympha sp. TaxID=1580831 RepID=UPI000781289A|nr:hypothetical protein [Treponema endosymbiont of Eucomonympha sp.]